MFVYNNRGLYESFNDQQQSPVTEWTSFVDPQSIIMQHHQHSLRLQPPYCAAWPAYELHKYKVGWRAHRHMY